MPENPNEIILGIFRSPDLRRIDPATVLDELINNAIEDTTTSGKSTLRRNLKSILRSRKELYNTFAESRAKGNLGRRPLDANFVQGTNIAASASELAQQMLDAGSDPAKVSLLNAYIPTWLSSSAVIPEDSTIPDGWFTGHQEISEISQFQVYHRAGEAVAGKSSDEPAYTPEEFSFMTDVIGTKIYQETSRQVDDDYSEANSNQWMVRALFSLGIAQSPESVYLAATDGHNIASTKNMISEAIQAGSKSINDISGRPRLNTTSVKGATRESIAVERAIASYCSTLVTSFSDITSPYHADAVRFYELMQETDGNRNDLEWETFFAVSLLIGAKDQTELLDYLRNLREASDLTGNSFYAHEAHKFMVILGKKFDLSYLTSDNLLNEFEEPQGDFISPDQYIQNLDSLFEKTYRNSFEAAITSTEGALLGNNLPVKSVKIKIDKDELIQMVELQIGGDFQGDLHVDERRLSKFSTKIRDKRLHYTVDLMGEEPVIILNTIEETEVTGMVFDSLLSLAAIPIQRTLNNLADNARLEEQAATAGKSRRKKGKTETDITDYEGMLDSAIQARNRRTRPMIFIPEDETALSEQIDSDIRNKNYPSEIANWVKSKIGLYNEGGVREWKPLQGRYNGEHIIYQITLGGYRIWFTKDENSTENIMHYFVTLDVHTAHQLDSNFR